MPILAHMFNWALEEGLPKIWIIHVVVLTCKSGDHLQPGNYQTILIGHTVAKLYGAVLDAELKTYSEVKEFRKAFHTVPKDCHLHRLCILHTPSDMM